MDVEPSRATRPRAATRRGPADSASRSNKDEAACSASAAERVLVVDVGGSKVKILVTGQPERRFFRSGPTLTPQQMVSKVKQVAGEWAYDVVSIGYPGAVRRGRPIREPVNLGHGWVGFDFARAFGRPVKVVNDAAMQAMGSYKGGKMLFLGLGTGLGSTMIVEGNLVPMELGHLPYKKATFEHYVGTAGLNRDGKKKWRRNVVDVLDRLIAALLPDDIVIGGGNARKLAALPPHCRPGENDSAFRGGFQLWAKDNVVRLDVSPGHAALELLPQTVARSETSPRACVEPGGPASGE
jgi:polyphosphate glucokinase